MPFKNPKYRKLLRQPNNYVNAASNLKPKQKKRIPLRKTNSDNEQIRQNTSRAILIKAK